MIKLWNLKINNFKNHGGKFAEFLARFYMRLKGYKIVATNVKVGRGTTAGEVDFVALKGHTLVFVEVKKRQNLDVARYAILPQQQKRIVTAAKVFLQNNRQYQNYDVRFDAVLVKLPFTIEHIRNAWQEK